jgi:Domain of unknown function (DUF4249)
MIYRIFYFAFLLLFMGCNNFSSLEDIELPTHKAKLVVFANLQTAWDYGRVYVYKTRSSLDTSSGQVIKLDSIFQDSVWRVFLSSGLDTVNATVELFKNGVFFSTLERLRFDNFNRYWFTNNKRLEADGATYMLRVSAVGFETVESVQIMPPRIKLDSVKVLRKGFVYKDLSYYQNAYELLCFFKDSAAKTPNFYWTEISGSPVPTAGLLNLDPTMTTDILSDGGFDGKPFSWRVFYPNIFNLKLEGNNNNGQWIELHSTTRDALLFAHSAALNKSSQNNRFAEPTTLYSNIKNGYGLFTLSAVSEFYLKF